jgi:hypothetical protein
VIDTRNKTPHASIDTEAEEFPYLKKKNRRRSPLTKQNSSLLEGPSALCCTRFLWFSFCFPNMMYAHLHKINNNKIYHPWLEVIRPEKAYISQEIKIECPTSAAFFPRVLSLYENQIRFHFQLIERWNHLLRALKMQKRTGKL